MSQILRSWTFWIHSTQIEEYREDMERMVFVHLRHARGNKLVRALFRYAGDGTAEVTVLSLCKSIENIRAFVGPSYLQPVIPLPPRQSF